MPVPIEERYKQMFVQLTIASEFRFKIFAAWGWFYAAFAAAFAWMQSNANMKPFSWIVPFLALLATILFWLADFRNRPAIGAAKDVGAAIEADSTSEIPEPQRYFSRLSQGVRYGVIVNVFTIIMLVLLGAATVYLFCSRGEFPT